MATQHQNILKVDDIDESGDVILVFTSEDALSQRQKLRDALADAKALRLQAAEDAGHVDLTLDSPDPSFNISEPGGDIRVRVSSQVLVRKSPVFKIFLTGRRSLHKHVLATQSEVEFFDDEVDPEAFCHILNFLYDRWEEIPGFEGQNRLSYDTWLEALVIIDKYDLHRATRLLKSRWWDFFSKDVPQTVEQYQRKFLGGETDVLSRWISATHIMNKQNELENLFTIYKLCSTCRLDQNVLWPLPERLHMAEVQRLEAFNAVNKLLARFHRSMLQLDPEAVCSCSDRQVARECDRVTLRHIEKGLARSGFLAGTADLPRKRKSIDLSPPQIDPSKVTFSGLARRLRDMRFGHHCVDEAHKRAQLIKRKQVAAQVEQKQRQERDYQDPYMGSSQSLDALDWSSVDCFQQEPQPYPPYQAKRPRLTFAQVSSNPPRLGYLPFVPLPLLMPPPPPPPYYPYPTSTQQYTGSGYAQPQSGFTPSAMPLRASQSWGAVSSSSSVTQGFQGQIRQRGLLEPSPPNFENFADPFSPCLSGPDSEGTFNLPIDADAPLLESSKPSAHNDPPLIIPCTPTPAQNIRSILNAIETKLNKNVPAYTPPIIVD